MISCERSAAATGMLNAERFVGNGITQVVCIMQPHQHRPYRLPPQPFGSKWSSEMWSGVTKIERDRRL